MSENKFKTMRHIEAVRNHLNTIIKELIRRQELHDQSKLQSPEAEMFDEFTPKLRNSTYGSDEYKGFLKEMGAALKHHYDANRHHPEHFIMWQCVVCKRTFKDSEKYTGPHDDDGKTYYCPKCCEHGMIYECGLERCSGIYGMNLIDVIEMLCDWKSSTLRHNDGDIFKSIEINQKRFGYSDELKQLLINTVTWIHSQETYHVASES